MPGGKRAGALARPGHQPARRSVSPLAVVSGVGAGGSGTDYRGDSGPIVYGPVGINAPARWRIKVASGQAAAKARRARDATSMTRTPSFKSRRRRELRDGERVRPGNGITDGEHQPI